MGTSSNTTATPTATATATTAATPTPTPIAIAIEWNGVATSRARDATAPLHAQTVALLAELLSLVKAAPTNTTPLVAICASLTMSSVMHNLDAELVTLLHEAGRLGLVRTFRFAQMLPELLAETDFVTELTRLQANALAWEGLQSYAVLGSSLTDEDVVAVVSAHASEGGSAITPSLTSLSIDSSNIRDAGVVALCDAVQRTWLRASASPPPPSRSELGGASSPPPLPLTRSSPCWCTRSPPRAFLTSPCWVVAACTSPRFCNPSWKPSPATRVPFRSSRSWGSRPNPPSPR